jgi:hypothetical protein
MTGEGGLTQLKLHNENPQDNGHADKDTNAMYKQSLVMHPGSLLQTRSANLHHWVNHKAFVFSMWVKPHGSLHNQLNLLGLQGHSDDASFAPQCKLNAIDQQLNVFDADAKGGNNSFPGVGVDTLFSLPVEQWAHIVLHRTGTKSFRVYLNSLRLGEFSVQKLPDWWQDAQKSAKLNLSHHETNLDGYYRLSSGASSQATTTTTYNVYTLESSQSMGMDIHGSSTQDLSQQFGTLTPNDKAKSNFNILTTAADDIVPVYGNAALELKGKGRLQASQTVSTNKVMQTSYKAWALSCWVQHRSSKTDTKSVVTLVSYGPSGTNPGKSLIRLDFANDQVLLETPSVVANVSDLGKTLQDSSWHQLVVVTNVSHGTRALYIDGQRAALRKNVTTPTWWSSPSKDSMSMQVCVADVHTASSHLDMCVELPSFYMGVPHDTQHDQDTWAETLYDVQERMRQHSRSSTDIPMWFLGNAEASDINDASKGRPRKDLDSDGTWGDSLVKDLYIQQSKHASSKNVSLSRPLYKTVLDATPEGHMARATIGMLCVFPSYQGKNQPDSMLTGGNYGPHASTYGYEAIGDSPEVDPNKGLYQSAMALPEGAHLRAHGNSKCANKLPHGGAFTLSQSLTTTTTTTNEQHTTGLDDVLMSSPLQQLDNSGSGSGPELRGLSTWIYIEAFPNNYLRVLEIVPDGADPSQVNQVDDNKGDNNMQLLVDKANNRVKLFPNDSKSETARVEVDEVFPAKKWIHIHIARTEDKSFEWFVNGYYLFTFSPHSLPAWWGGKLPQYHFGRGDMKVWVDYLMWHHKTLTNKHLQTIIQKSAPSGYQPLQPQTLIPRKLLPDNISSTWSTYLMASNLSRFAQLAHGRQPMPILRAPSPQENITKIQHGVYKSGLHFGGRGTTMSAHTLHVESFLQKSTFIVGVWIMPQVAWGSLSEPIRVLHANAANEPADNNFHIGFDPTQSQVTFCSTTTKTSGITLDIPMSLPLHKWSHVVIYRRSSTRFALFVNGTHIGETTVQQMNMPGILMGAASGTTQSLHIGCMGRPTDDDDDDDTVSVGLDLVNFIHHTASVDPFSNKDIQNLYNTLQTEASGQTQFATAQPIRKPLFPGAHSLWNKEPGLLYVFPAFASGSAYCFGSLCAYGHDMSLGTGTKITTSGSKGVYANALEITQDSNGATLSRRRGQSPKDADMTLEKWLGMSKIAFTCWINILSSDWPTQSITLFKADSAAYSRSHHLQLTINGHADTVAILDNSDATANNVGIKENLPVGQWNHVGLVRTAATDFTVYMNGKAVHTFSFSGSDAIPKWWGHDQLKVHVGKTTAPPSDLVDNDDVVGVGGQSSIMRMDYITFWGTSLSKSNLHTLIHSTTPNGDADLGLDDSHSQHSHSYIRDNNDMDEKDTDLNLGIPFRMAPETMGGGKPSSNTRQQQEQQSNCQKRTGWLMSILLLVGLITIVVFVLTVRKKQSYRSSSLSGASPSNTVFLQKTYV